jgi:myo-inositol-hexaphosphate 3-phosphohydrolase
MERIVHEKRQSSKVTFTVHTDGILKEDERGALIAESLEDFTFYRLKTETIRGRNKEIYEKICRKSIYKFGTGFIH